MHPLHQVDTRKIYTVAEVTRDISSLLEDNFPSLWITAEISNFKLAASGHAYLTLKDSDAQISGVMFRPQFQKLKFNLEDGLEVVVHGRISVYGPRGQYQIIIDAVEPKGLGALQLAFEQLKERLAAEGLFDEAHKKELPFFPEKIGVITSPTGAVIHDLVTVMSRRFPGIPILLYPVRVQGEGAAAEIAQAIRAMNQRTDLSLLIVGRGGGSLEDLWAFNEEAVVRAVFESKLPVVSAVGHETDFTLCDLVADLRAPTPSAAAELSVPKKEDLLFTIREKRSSLYFAILQNFKLSREKLKFLRQGIKHPRKILEDLRLRLSDLQEKNISSMKHFLKNHRSRFREANLKLSLLSPLGPLNRGYSILMKNGSPVRSIRQIKEGEVLSVRLNDGEVVSVVREIKPRP